METGLNVGDVVSGLEPDEHVEVQEVKPFGGKTLVVGIGVRSRRQIKRPLSPDELAGLTVVRGVSFTFDGEPETFLVGVEAHRIRIAHQFDPLFAVNSSVVDVLPHQVEAVYRYLLPMPRIRFLLADDTGAGKTIMAGLLIKELLFRGVINKVLIITPGGLTGQWQDEMQDKFGLSFRRINRAAFDAEPGQFARSDDGLFIVSIDFISGHDGCLNAAQETQWDMIIVDEAHKLSAYEYGSKVDRSRRYQAVEALVPRTDHILFLTATPHRGRKDTFRRLLMLLDEDLFQKDEYVTHHVRQAVSQYTGEQFEGENTIIRHRNRFFLRRLKEEMLDWDEHPLFKPRHTNTAGYDLTPQELELYEAVTKYVRSRRKEAKAKRNRNVELTLLVMQRRLASSIRAITKTLKNRLSALDEVLKMLSDPSRSAAEKKRLLRGSDDDIPKDIVQYEELDENERDAVDKRIFRQVLSDKPEDVEQERIEVANLFHMAELLRNHPEAKFTELLTVLDTSDVIRREDEKLVIFTEHKDTMDGLEERLKQKGYTVVCIHGSMDVDARKQVQRDFRTRAKILIATDAAGEGINLQFCRFLINWDIPWNPNRLEQRMGRIHRYGQHDDVWVYNLVAVNTREGSVLAKVLQKLDVMREQMGTDRVYDVIDELLEDVPLVELLQKAIDVEDRYEALEKTQSCLDTNLQGRAEELISLQKKQSLSSRVNIREARELRDASDERRLQPHFVEKFFIRAYTAAGGTVTEDKHFPVIHLGKNPTALIEMARQAHFPLADKYDTPFVFDKELVSVASKIRVPDHTRLLGPGHPLFNVLLEWAMRSAADAFAKGAVLLDPNLEMAQRIWLVRSSVLDGRREEKKRLAHEQLSVVIADNAGFRATSPASLLNAVAPESIVTSMSLPEHDVEEVQVWAYESLTEKQLEKVRNHRQNECDVRREYLQTTFTELVLELQEKLNNLQQAQLFGDDDVEERTKLEQRVQELKRRKADRLAELELMLRLNANLPDVLTSALMIPAPVASSDQDDGTLKHGVPMKRDDDVERIAMDAAMQYELSRGWTPVDVSQDGEHYDIRSESPTGEKRYIEVKGRAQSGAVVLTGPEVDKLRQLGDRAWLYVVCACKSPSPVLRYIQDPIPKLNLDALYRQVQFIVQEQDWLSHGQPTLLN